MSENRLFVLKQKNHDVAVMQLSLDGEIENYEIINPARMPYLGSTEKKHIYSWWKDRAIPEGRDRLLELLKEYDCESPQELLMKNLGLSLTDTYWISPAELDLTWEEVNLFDNGEDKIDFHDGEGRIHYSNSKDAALGMAPGIWKSIAIPNILTGSSMLMRPLHLWFMRDRDLRNLQNTKS